MSIIISPEVCPHCYHKHGHYERRTCWTCGGSGVIHCNHNYWQPTWTLTSNTNFNSGCWPRCCVTVCSSCNGLGYTSEWVYDPYPCCVIVNCENEKPKIKEKPENNFRQGLGVNKKKFSL